MGKPAFLCGKRFQEASITPYRLMDFEALLNFPDARGDGLDHGHTEFAFQRFDQADGLQRGAKDVNGVGAFVLIEGLLDDQDKPFTSRPENQEFDPVVGFVHAD